MKLGPFATASSREVVRLSTDVLSGVPGPKSVGAFRLLLRALRTLTSSERGLRKLGTFHSFLDRISADVQKWHDDTMLVSCLVQELPIFLARWEMSVERTFKYIAKRSAKKARRVAKTKAKDMTQQANSRVIALGGLPAPLWTSESSARTT